RQCCRVFLRSPCPPPPRADRPARPAPRRRDHEVHACVASLRSNPLNHAKAQRHEDNRLSSLRLSALGSIQFLLCNVEARQSLKSSRQLDERQGLRRLQVDRPPRLGAGGLACEEHTPAVSL